MRKCVRLYLAYISCLININLPTPGSIPSGITWQTVYLYTVQLDLECSGLVILGNEGLFFLVLFFKN